MKFTSIKQISLLRSNQHDTGNPSGRLKQAGGLVFSFFLIKGLFWLSIPVWVWLKTH